jgi:hypothetical protein
MRTPSGAREVSNDRDNGRAPLSTPASNIVRAARDGHANAGRRSLGGYGTDASTGRVDGSVRRSSLGGFGVDGATGRSSPVAGSTPVQPSYPASSASGQTASTPVQPSYTAPGNGHTASTPVLQHHVAGGTPIGQMQQQTNVRAAGTDDCGRGRDAAESTPGKQAPDLASLVSMYVCACVSGVCVCMHIKGGEGGGNDDG